MLVEIGGVLTRAVDGSPFEKELLALFVPLLADEAGIVLSGTHDSPGNSTWFRAGTGTDRTGRLPGVPPPELADAVLKVLSHGRIEKIREVSGGVTGIALPLSGRSGIYGSLALSSLRHYTNSDLELMEIIASRTAASGKTNCE